MILFLTTVELSDVLMPPKLRKRGRPKGSEKTVIGIPRRKKRKLGPVPFIKKLPLEKDKSIIYYPDCF